MGRQLEFLFEQNKCIGCKACQIACKDKNGLAKGQFWRQVTELKGDKCEESDEALAPQIDAHWISSSCHHCKEPVCKSVCKAGAITKTEEEGIVLINSESCISCRRCEDSCPHDALQYMPRKNKMSKCDFCYDLIHKNENPVCIAACPMRVLDYKNVKK